MSDEILSVVIAGIIGVSGTLLGSITTWLFSINLQRDKQRREWNKEYHESILAPFMQVIDKTVVLVLSTVKLKGQQEVYDLEVKDKIISENFKEVNKLLLEASGLQAIAMLRASNTTKLAQQMFELNETAIDLVSGNASETDLDSKSKKFLQLSKDIYTELRHLTFDV